MTLIRPNIRTSCWMTLSPCYRATLMVAIHYGRHDATASDALLDCAIALGIFVGGLATLLAIFGNYMPMIEFREFIQGEYGSMRDLSSASKLAAILTSAANREIPGAYAEWLGSACGLSIPCL